MPWTYQNKSSCGTRQNLGLRWKPVTLKKCVDTLIKIFTWQSTTCPNPGVKIGWSPSAFSSGFEHRSCLAAALSKAAWTGSESPTASCWFFLPIAIALRAESPTTPVFFWALHPVLQILWKGFLTPLANLFVNTFRNPKQTLFAGVLCLDLGVKPSPALIGLTAAVKKWIPNEPQMNPYQPHFFENFRVWNHFWGVTNHGPSTPKSGLSTPKSSRSTVAPRWRHGPTFLDQTINCFGREGTSVNEYEPVDFKKTCGGYVFFAS